MGPVMLDVQGTSLTEEDKEILQHPLVGGLIYFTRNFQSIAQITELTQAIKNTAKKPILIGVDHEGGRVQRFRDGFTRIPAMGDLWHKSGKNITSAKQLSKQCAMIIALEIQAIGIDFSFAPVLDIDNISHVVGDRGFHKNPEIVSALAEAFIDGFHEIGMKSTAKHFPGHGSVKVDSHIELPLDFRDKESIFQQDLMPFQNLIAKRKVDAVMPAHIIYPDVDSVAVGFSRIWLQTILRQQLNFNGVIFSDDLSMQGAASIGGYIERAEAAQAAGCDMLLLCNSRAGCIQVLDKANISIKPESQNRLKQFINATTNTGFHSLATNPIWQNAKQVLGL